MNESIHRHFLQSLRQLSRFGLISVLAALSVTSQGQIFSNADNALSDYDATPYRPSINCRALADFTYPDLLTISTKSVRAMNGNPAHCQISGMLDPEISFVVELPDNWNGRFYMIGNGGHAGQRPDDPFQIAARSSALQQSFATASTNTGHNADEEPGATFVLSDPQKAIDYAYRAVHLTAVTAKAITARYYGQEVNYAYWNSCSNGGRQGLMEAQRYPEDFDGIIANAPWVDQTGFTIGALWNQQAFAETPVSARKMALVAALAGGVLAVVLGR